MKKFSQVINESIDKDELKDIFEFLVDYGYKYTIKDLFLNVENNRVFSDFRYSNKNTLKVKSIYIDNENGKNIHALSLSKYRVSENMPAGYYQGDFKELNEFFAEIFNCCSYLKSYNPRLIISDINHIMIILEDSLK